LGVIEIDKESIPYDFDLELSGRVYNFTINYNYLFDYFTVDLKLDKKILIQGEKLILNEILFRECYEDKEHNLDEEFPSEILMPIASSNDIDRVSYNNLGTDIQLYYAERSELNE